MDGDAYYMKVTRIPWEPQKYILDGTDYIVSLLIETPGKYYLTPNRQLAFVYIIGRGLVPFRHDFTGLSDEDTDRLIYHIRRDLSR